MPKLSSEVIKILIATVIIIVGYFGSIALGNYYYSRQTKDINAASQKLEVEYAKQAEKITDAYILVSRGVRQINNNNLNLALINLRQATKLEPKYRDGWLYLALAQIKTADFSGAIANLKKAESIDPINPQIYQYLAVAYARTDDPAAAQKAQEKYDFLVKK